MFHILLRAVVSDMSRDRDSVNGVYMVGIVCLYIYVFGMQQICQESVWGRIDRQVG